MRKLILIIEDDEIIRLIVFNLLESRNFNVISAEDGFRGLKLAKELQPDLILCDINMPKLNGYEVLKELRKNLITVNIPFIFLSSEADRDSRYHAQQLGANDYLTKPLQLEKLLEAMTNQFKNLPSREINFVPEVPNLWY